MPFINKFNILCNSHNGFRAGTLQMFYIIYLTILVNNLIMVLMSLGYLLTLVRLLIPCPIKYY